MPPYPAHLVTTLTLADGTPVTVRPIAPADAAIEQQFVRGLSNEARYFRFMDMLRELTPNLLKQLTDIDYHNQMALIAVISDGAHEVQIAVGRYVVHPGTLDCEFAIVVTDRWQRNGIATALMRLLIESARASGLRKMIGEVLATNNKMLAFMHKLGFQLAMDAGDSRQMRATLELRAA
jgi:acetyltransferase